MVDLLIDLLHLNEIYLVRFSLVQGDKILRIMLKYWFVLIL